MSKCSDEIWLKSVVGGALAKYMVENNFINDESELDVNTGWGDNKVSLPVHLDQISNGITKLINARLAAEGCPRFAGIPNSQWTLDHMPKKVAKYISDVVVLILSPPTPQA